MTLERKANKVNDIHSTSISNLYLPGKSLSETAIVNLYQNDSWQLTHALMIIKLCKYTQIDITDKLSIYISSCNIQLNQIFNDTLLETSLVSFF